MTSINLSMSCYCQHVCIITTVNTLRPRQNCRNFADDIFKSIFFNENVQILIKISLTFVPKAPINNIPAQVQIMAWRQSGNKPLSEPMMVSLLTHICVTRPQWVEPWQCLGVVLLLCYCWGNVSSITSSRGWGAGLAPGHRGDIGEIITWVTHTLALG